jgi:hypothetical protein
LHEGWRRSASEEIEGMIAQMQSFGSRRAMRLRQHSPRIRNFLKQFLGKRGFIAYADAAKFLLQHAWRLVDWTKSAAEFSPRKLFRVQAVDFVRFVEIYRVFQAQKSRT